MPRKRQSSSSAWSDTAAGVGAGLDAGPEDAGVNASGAHGGPPGLRTPGMDALAAVLRNVTGEQLRAILKRDRSFTFRLSAMDRNTMERAAKAVGLSTAEYLIRLHYHAYERLKEAGAME